MRSVLLLIVLFVVRSASCQTTVWQQNKSSIDSLISIYRTISKYSLTGSNLKQEKKKRRIDLKVIDFLNKFYFGELNASQIESILENKFGQSSWRLGERRSIDSFHIYKRRLRSYGNFEPFVIYVVLNNEVVGTQITIRIRSTLDCLQLHDREIPDLLYLSSFIPDRINFPFEMEGWTEHFDSKMWVRKELSFGIKNQILDLIRTEVTGSAHPKN